MKRGMLTKIREKLGESNAYKYKTKGPYAGPDKTFPINNIGRARNALARAHFSPNPEKIRANVYRHWPKLKKRKEEREGED